MHSCTDFDCSDVATKIAALLGIQQDIGWTFKVDYADSLEQTISIWRLALPNVVI